MNYVNKNISLLLLAFLIVSSNVLQSVDFEHMDSNEDSSNSSQNSNEQPNWRSSEPPTTQNIYIGAINNFNIKDASGQSTFSSSIPSQPRSNSRDQNSIPASITDPKEPSFISKVASSTQSSFLSLYDKAFSWIIDNPRITTAGALASFVAYKIYNKKSDIKQGIQNKYSALKQNILNKKEDIEAEATDVYLDFYEQYDNLIQEGKSHNEALYLLTKNNIKPKYIVYSTVGTVGTGAALAGALYYKNAIKDGTSLIGNLAVDKAYQVKDGGVKLLKKADSAYTPLFTRACNWAKNHPQAVLTTAGSAYAGWLGYKAVKAFKSSSAKVRSLDQLIKSLSSYQLTLLKDDKYYGEDKLNSLITAAADNLNMLKNEQKFYVLLSPKQRLDLEALIQQSLL